MFAELKNEVSSECECGMNKMGPKNDNLETSRRIYRMKKKRKERHDRTQVCRPIPSRYHQTQGPA